MTALFVANPVVIAVSYTFLTDVHFWSLTMLAVFLVLRGVRRGHAVSYWAGWAAILAATLVRQLGLAIPIGLVIALALKDGVSRSWLFRVVISSVAPVHRRGGLPQDHAGHDWRGRDVRPYPKLIGSRNRRSDAPAIGGTEAFPLHDRMRSDAPRMVDAAPFVLLPLSHPSRE